MCIAKKQAHFPEYFFYFIFLHVAAQIIKLYAESSWGAEDGNRKDNTRMVRQKELEAYLTTFKIYLKFTQLKYTHLN